MTDFGEQSRNAAVLLRLARAVSSSIDQDELLDLVVHEVAAVTGADRASIWLYDRHHGTLTSAAIHGIDPEFAARWRGDQRHWEDEPLSRLAIDTGEIIVSENALGDPRADTEAVRFFGDRSILVAPLVARGIPMGTLYLNHVHQHHVYSDSERELITAIAASVAQSMRNAELYAESQRRGELLQRSFQRIGEVLASGVRFDETLAVIVASAVEFLGADSGGVVLAGENPSVRGEIGVHGEAIAQVAALLDGQLGDDTATGEVGSASYLAASLTGRSGTLGVLVVLVADGELFDSDAASALRGFAAQAAIALEDSRLFDLAIAREANARRRAETLDQLNVVGTLLNESLDLNTVLETITNSAKELIEADSASIIILDEQSDRPFAVTAPSGTPTPVRPNGLTNYIRQSGDIVLVTDTSLDHRVNPEIVASGVRSMIGIPLRVDGRVVGVLYLNSMRVRDYSDSIVTICEILASQASVAWKNARYFHAVSEEKEKLASIVENSSDGILLIDADRRVQAANPALLAMTGWTAAEADERRCDEVLGCGGSDQATCAACPLGSRTNGRLPVDLGVWTKAGKSLSVSVTSGTGATPTGAPAFGVAVIRDMTAVRRLEDAKSHFVALISHELRTPLFLVKGFLSTLQRAESLGVDALQRATFLSNAEAAADRLGRLINDLVTASKLDAGKLSLSREPVDMSDVAYQEQSWQEALGTGRILIVDVPSEPAMVYADRQRLEEIVHNLVDNAAKYSPVDRPIRVTVVKADRAGGPGWAVTVRDEGPGLESDDITHIFERFYRGETAESSAVSGMGLGLTIVHGLVEAHDGTIAVESAPGQGSAFTVTLPAVTAAQRGVVTLPPAVGAAWNQ